MEQATRQPRTLRISRHVSTDWCHLCGERKDSCVDIWCPPNAEHLRQGVSATGKDRYFRICRECLTRAQLVFKDGGLDEPMYDEIREIEETEQFLDENPDLGG